MEMLRDSSFELLFPYISEEFLKNRRIFHNLPKNGMLWIAEMRGYNNTQGFQNEDIITISSDQLVEKYSQPTPAGIRQILNSDIREENLGYPGITPYLQKGHITLMVKLHPSKQEISTHFALRLNLLSIQIEMLQQELDRIWSLRIVNNPFDESLIRESDLPKSKWIKTFNELFNKDIKFPLAQFLVYLRERDPKLDSKTWTELVNMAWLAITKKGPQAKYLSTLDYYGWFFRSDHFYGKLDLDLEKIQDAQESIAEFINYNASLDDEEKESLLDILL